MINVSKKFKEMLLNDQKHFLLYLDIVLSDGTKLNLDRSHIWNGGFSIEDAVSSDNSFDVGSAIINSGKFVLNNIYDDFSEYDFENAKVTAWTGLETSEGVIERFEKGTYIVNEPKYNGALISLSCYDNMVLFDRPYSESNLVYPATLNQIVRDACTVCGVTLQSVSFPHDDYIVQSRPEDEAITFREVIRWCAQIACCFARCDATGRLELKWYNQTVFERNSIVDGGVFNPWTDNGEVLDGGTFNPWTENVEIDGGSFEDMQYYHHIFSTKSISVGTDDVVITGVKVLEKDTSADYSNNYVEYFTGKAGYVVEIKDNMLIQNGKGLDISNYLGQQLIGFSFRKATVSHVSDPTIEAGDIAYLSDYKNNSYPILISSTTFTSGDFQKTVSSAADVAKNSAKRYSETTKNYVELRKQLKIEKTEREKALQNLSELLEKSSGAYTTVVKAADGGNVYYLHNKPVLYESDMVWKMTAEAWGVSTDGGKTWNAGMTVDGDAIVRILTATGVNADWITAGEILVTDSNGNTIFSVNMDTKKVLISGDNVVIGGKSASSVITDSISEANNYTDNKIGDYANEVEEDILNLQAQIDGQIESYSYDYEPTLQNYPAIEWTTTTERTKHIGDIFFWTSTGYTYRFLQDGATWKWQLIQDTDITKAIALAENAGNVANSKKRVFVVQPAPPYDIGDLWTQGTSGDIMVCSTARSTGSYIASDWKKSNKYIDSATVDVAIGNYDNSLNQLKIFNKLTNNGVTQGIYLQDGKLFINGEFIKASSISGESIEAKSITSDKVFIVDISSLNATIGGWNIDSTGIYKIVNAQYEDDSDIEEIVPEPETYSENALAGNSVYEVRFQALTDAMDANNTPVLFCSIDGKKTFVLWANGSSDFGNTHIYSDGSILASKITSRRNYTSTSFSQIVMEDSAFKFWDDSFEMGYMEPVMEQWIEDGMTNVQFVLETDLVFRCDFVEQSSDERKKNITEWDERYEDFLLNIDPINFTWKNNVDQRQHTGIGAQSAKKLMKELGIERNGLVSGSEERGYTVAYSELHAMEIAVIQKQEKRIRELEDTVRMLLEKIQ